MNVGIAELESQHHEAGSLDYALSFEYLVWSSIIYHAAKTTCTFIHHTRSTNFILHTGWNAILDRLNRWIMADHLTVMHVSNIIIIKPVCKSNLFSQSFLRLYLCNHLLKKLTVARHYKLPEEWLEYMQWWTEWFRIYHVWSKTLLAVHD